MEDVAGRINCENLTTDEWNTLETAHFMRRWFTPTPEQWATVRGLLALVDVRRGYELHDDMSMVLGVAQIRINKHGTRAIVARANSDVYIVGEPLSEEQVLALYAEEGW